MELVRRPHLHGTRTTKEKKSGVLMVPRWCGDGPRCLEDGRESRSRDRGHTVEAAMWVMWESAWSRRAESATGVAEVTVRSGSSCNHVGGDKANPRQGSSAGLKLCMARSPRTVSSFCPIPAGRCSAAAASCWRGPAGARAESATGVAELTV